jgi:hypothetical protein
MSTTKTGKLNDAASEFQAGASTGFGFRFGVKYYCREDKKQKWCNYEGALFSNNENQIAYLRDNLIEGAVITVSAKEQYPSSFEGQNGVKLSIKLNDCNLDYVAKGLTANQTAVYQGQQAASASAPQNQAPQSNSFANEIAEYNAITNDGVRNAKWASYSPEIQKAILASYDQ